ncbi:hypothetical protein Pmani_022448 [Petrolisthes manimaculis]|uniref:Uncharacterized protein n=1 Tax=Petrolisthes manimaculis TaxID=1843537 RepID=A0AAE1PEB1_9EUCA|nr:hypothetical protein Pmani_022448 [Petrolisthes manimaculis]
MVLVLLRTSMIAADFNYIRYDLTNFNDIISGTSYEVMDYTSIDDDYNVSVPSGGEDSGGIFLFDVSSYSCISVSVSLDSSLTVYLSFWCDHKDSELYMRTQCNDHMQLYLCNGNETPDRNGKWNEVKWENNCKPRGEVSSSSPQHINNGTSYGLFCSQD